MEFPILQKLRLPETAIRMVTEFLRKPHPTAALIKALHFDHYPWGFALSGDAIRCHRQNVYPQRFCRGNLTDVSIVREFDEEGEFVTLDDSDALTIDDMRTLGFAEGEILAMGF